MFIVLTNARTGKPFPINPTVIGDVQERVDPNYPKTKCALIKTDGNFIPVAEDIMTVINMLPVGRQASRGAAPQHDPNDPGPQER